MIGSTTQRWLLRIFVITVLASACSSTEECGDYRSAETIDESRLPTCEESLSIERVISSWGDQWGRDFQTHTPLTTNEIECVRNVQFAAVNRARFQAICGAPWASGRNDFVGSRACAAGQRCFRACYVPNGSSAVLVFYEGHPFEWRRQSIRHEVIHRVLRCIGEDDRHSNEAFVHGSGALSIELRSAGVYVGDCR